MKARTLPGLLPPTGVSCLAWFLYLGLAPGTPLTEAAAIGVAVGPARLLFMTVPLAFIGQGLVRWCSIRGRAISENGIKISMVNTLTDVFAVHTAVPGKIPAGF